MPRRLDFPGFIVEGRGSVMLRVLWSLKKTELPFTQGS